MGEHWTGSGAMARVINECAAEPVIPGRARFAAEHFGADKNEIKGHADIGSLTRPTSVFGGNADLRVVWMYAHEATRSGWANTLCK